MRPTAIAILLTLLGSICSPHWINATPSDPVELWPNGAPGAKGEDEADTPVVRVYLPQESDQNSDAGVVIFPGGGYRVVAIDHEGVQVARRLNERGIAAFVVTYRLMPTYTPADALADAQRAIRFVRSNAAEFGISPDRIGALGFSAGGHLTSTVGTTSGPGDPDAEDPIERVHSRPDFIVPCYPVINGELLNRENNPYRATDLQVTAETPPTFLFHTTEDTGVIPEHSIRFYQALQAYKIPSELHIFGQGPHGVGLAPGDPSTGAWFDLLVNWLRSSGFLTASERAMVSGTILVDAAAINRGWITFVPIGPDASTRPVASAYITDRRKGAFSIDARHGPCPGPHRIEILRVANALERNPSVDDAVLLAGPGTDIELTTMIVPGENTINLELRQD